MSRHTLPTACPLDCPDACSLSATVAGDRLEGLEASAANPYTAGFICSKVRRLADHVYSAERLRSPLLRQGAKGAGEFREIGWDEALDRVAAELRAVGARSGGEAILPYAYGGSNGLLSHEALDARFFRRLGASRLDRTVCAAGTGAAALGLYGKMPGVALTDLPQARLVVVWGSNPHAAGIHLVPPILEARRRGARLVVIDPRRTPLAAGADLHLAPRPGTDLPLALALIRWFFETGRADLGFLARHTNGWSELRRRAEPWTIGRAAEVAEVQPESLAAFAELYADHSPALIRCGWGPERNRNGGSAIAAILALPAVAGKFGVRGGGYTMSNSTAWRLKSEAAVAEAETTTRRINMNRLGEALLTLADPRIEFLFVYNSNALSTTPNQRRVQEGLARTDLFTVVFDQVMTDTARWADIVLPATTLVEHEELSRGYGAYSLQRGRPVIPPVGAARPNFRVFRDLLRRLDLSRPGDVEEEEEFVEALLGAGEEGDRLRRELAAQGMAVPPSGAAPVQFIDVFPRTPDQRVDLVPEALDREAPFGLYRFQPEPELPSYPLALISPASGRRISSSFGYLEKGLVPVEISPADAQARGVATGRLVRVFNALGEVRTTARVNPELRSGVALLPKGLWARHTANGATANALAPDTLADVGAGACFNDARVEIAPLDAG